MKVTLRPVTMRDVDVFFEQQRDPESNTMAGFPPREEVVHRAHWDKVLADPTGVTRTVVADRAVAGNVVSFEVGGDREVGYWIARDVWGRGVATQALALFLDIERTRPLYGAVASHNAGSIRVLEKCGFARTPNLSFTDQVAAADVVARPALRPLRRRTRPRRTGRAECCQRGRTRRRA